MVNQNIKEMKKKDARALVRELKDNNGSVRRSAALALGEIGDPKAVQPMIEVLRLSERAFLTNFDFNMQFMKIISSAPGEIGDSRAVKQLILSLKREAEWTVRQNADKALVGEIGDSRAVKQLSKTIKKKNDESVRKLAEKAL